MSRGSTATVPLSNTWLLLARYDSKLEFELPGGTEAATAEVVRAKAPRRWTTLLLCGCEVSAELLCCIKSCRFLILVPVFYLGICSKRLDFVIGCADEKLDKWVVRKRSPYKHFLGG